VFENIISYLEMCRREGASLQQGMNFRLRNSQSVILMSVRPSAPYRDRLEDGGTTLIYEGHDCPRSPTCPNPKIVDQPDQTSNGRLTQNGKFLRAADDAKRGERTPEQVRVYEKLRPGIWAYNGMFHLMDAWIERDENRKVYKFKLVAVGEAQTSIESDHSDPERRRIIPSDVKLEVWKRDQGKCTLCGAADELHFDHIVPFSKGGTSLVAANIQLLCARHNLVTRDRIE
jgi:hypothetical protein